MSHLPLHKLPGISAGIPLFSTSSAPVVFLKTNFAAVAVPTSSNDSSQGYQIGSLWIYGSAIYICTSNQVSNAVWVLLSNISTSGTSILQGNGTGGFQNITVGAGLTLTGSTLAFTPSTATLPYTLPPITKVKTQVITTTGTYTPTTGMVFAEVEVWGGGGGGGSAASPSSSGHGAASGGGSGGYAKKLFTAAQIGSSQTVTIGAGGAGAGSSPATGSSGGTTTFGSSLNLYAGGGNGGLGDGGTTGFTATIPGEGGVSANGDINGSGNTGMGGVGSGIAARSGWGADAIGGVGLAGQGNATQATGLLGAAGGNATGYNAGGAGGLAVETSSPWAGGNGAPGLCVITEYINA